MNDINHADNPNSEITGVTSQAKRRLLSGLGAGGSVLGIGAVVPGTWVKPVANAVILPVHAQTTPLDAATIAAASPTAPTSFFPLRGGGRRDGIRIRWTNPETPLGDGVDLYRARYRLMGETGDHLVLGFRPLATGEGNGNNDESPDETNPAIFLVLPDDDLTGNPARVPENAMYEIQVEAIYYEEGNDTPPAADVQGQFLSPTVTVTPGVPT